MWKNNQNQKSERERKKESERDKANQIVSECDVVFETLSPNLSTVVDRNLSKQKYASHSLSKTRAK
jgi:hypothetical protein